MKMKKFLAVCLSALTVTGMLAGCGGAKGGDTSSAGAEKEGSSAEGSVYYLNFIFPIDIPEPWSLKDVHPPVLSTPDIASCAAL